mmetsp:Transcript_33158/g.63894  ORF Transcript_33158/g.63894 Transcript_33158/m.63894 type:complete len:105 (-) Transcript_33158:173-487(-)
MNARETNVVIFAVQQDIDALLTLGKPQKQKTSGRRQSKMRSGVYNAAFRRRSKLRTGTLDPNQPGRVTNRTASSRGASGDRTEGCSLRASVRRNVPGAVAQRVA